MLNLRDNIIISISIVTVFIMMTGIAVAADAVAQTGENLSVTWDEDGIEAKAWTFKEVSCNSVTKYFYYQIRYYQPGTFNRSNIYDSENLPSSAEGPYAENNLDGFYIVSEKFIGNNTEYPSTDPWTEKLTNPDNGWVQGEWTVVLLKAGKAVDCQCCDDCSKCCKEPCECCDECCKEPCECCDEPCKLANSYRIHVPIYVPIPEFSTIALPIAAILGLMFILQSRRRKED